MLLNVIFEIFDNFWNWCTRRVPCFSIEYSPLSEKAILYLSLFHSQWSKERWPAVFLIPALEDSKFVMPYQNTIRHNKCKANDYDKYQYCLCQSGQRISVFKSHHHNPNEDRIWQLECAPMQAKLYIPCKDSNESAVLKFSVVWCTWVVFLWAKKY